MFLKPFKTILLATAFFPKTILLATGSFLRRDPPHLSPEGPPHEGPQPHLSAEVECCSICLEDFVTADRSSYKRLAPSGTTSSLLRQIPYQTYCSAVSALHACGHLFHSSCLRRLVEKNNNYSKQAPLLTCPLCRAPLLNAKWWLRSNKMMWGSIDQVTKHFPKITIILAFAQLTLELPYASAALESREQGLWNACLAGLNALESLSVPIVCGAIAYLADRDMGNSNGNNLEGTTRSN